VRRVVVTGLGVVAPTGIGKDAFAKAMFSGESGIRKITSFDASEIGVSAAGEVNNFDPVDFMPVHIVRKSDRFVHLGLAATKLAVEDARLDLESKYFQSAAVVLGSGQGGLMFHEQTILQFLQATGTKKVPASAVPRITSNAVSAYLAIHYHLKGPNQVISTACSSGTQAIGLAYLAIKRGFSDIAITGGVEAPISPVMLAMYNSMMVLGSPLNGNPASASRPFDATRNGFVLSEGSGILVLELLESARARGATIYAEIIGFGSNCGAYHMVSPDPSGEDAASVMRDALKDAKLSPDNVDYINAHGTSTKWNDLAETRGIKLLLGERAKKVPVSSLKSMIGHTIGASGAIQGVASCLIFDHNRIFPTINLKNSDPECDLDYVPNTARDFNGNVIVSNSFGFGSNNAALVFRRFNNA